MLARSCLLWSRSPRCCDRRPRPRPARAPRGRGRARATPRRAGPRGSRGAAAAPAGARALPPMNCNSFGCYPAEQAPAPGAAPAAPRPAAARPPTVTEASSPRALRARALSGAGVRFYGAYWCGFCDKQRRLLGAEASKLLDYVECDPGGAGADAKACAAAGVQAFPTWSDGAARAARGSSRRRAREARGARDRAEDLRADAAAAAEAARPARRPPVVGRRRPGDCGCESARARGATMCATPRATLARARTLPRRRSGRNSTPARALFPYHPRASALPFDEGTRRSGALLRPAAESSARGAYALVRDVEGPVRRAPRPRRVRARPRARHPGVRHPARAGRRAGHAADGARRGERRSSARSRSASPAAAPARSAASSSTSVGPCSERARGRAERSPYARIA